MGKVDINLEKCDGCGMCVDACPAGVLELRGGKSVAVNVGACYVCHCCEPICPNGAILAMAEMD